MADMHCRISSKDLCFYFLRPSLITVPVHGGVSKSCSHSHGGTLFSGSFSNKNQLENVERFSGTRARDSFDRTCRHALNSPTPDDNSIKKTNRNISLKNVCKHSIYFLGLKTAYYHRSGQFQLIDDLPAHIRFHGYFRHHSRACILHARTTNRRGDRYKNLRLRSLLRKYALTLGSHTCA